MFTMKRSFHFRVWDEQAKKFNYFDLSSDFSKIPDDLKGNLQQSTEMRTQDGRELFEGDIIEFIWANSKRKAIIKYKHASFVAELIEPEGTLSFQWLHSLYLYDNPIEVLGNNQENPELLKTTP